MELRQVLEALRNADAAGDVEAAARLAQIAKAMMDAGAPLPQEAPKKSGLVASIQRGAEQLISSGRTAYEAVTGDAEAAAKAGIERGQDIERRLPGQLGTAKIGEAYEKDGVAAAGAEVGRQVPHAFAEQGAPMGSAVVGSRLGAAIAGAGLGLRAPLPLPARLATAAVGAGVGAYAPSYVQQFGGNIEAQARAGKPIDVAEAAITAAPQAALDVIAKFVPLGRSLVSKLTGVPFDKLMGKTAAQTTKLAEERLLTTLAKGTATGALAEIPTEITQQMLERAQAGLSLTDEDALREYGETAYQVGLLAPIGAAGRYADRGAAKTQVREKAEEAARAEREAAVKEEEDYKQSPQYVFDIGQKFDDLNEQIVKAKAANPRPGKNATPAAWMQYKEQAQAIAELNKQLKDLYPEYKTVKPAWEQEKARRAQAAQAVQPPAPPAPAAPPVQQAPPPAQATLPGITPIEPTTPMPEAEDVQEPLRLAQQQQELAQLLEDQQQQESDAAAARDVAKLRELQKRRSMLQNEYDYVSKKLSLLGGYVDPVQEANKANAALEKAYADLERLSGEAYDPVKADKLLEKITALEEKVKELGPVQESFAAADFRPRPLRPLETKGEFAARVYEPGAQDIEQQEQAYLEESRAADEARIAEAQRERRIAPEKLALQRMGQRPAPRVGEGQVSTEVDALVDLLSVPKDGQKQTGRVIAGAGQTEAGQLDLLKGELTAALITNNTKRIEEVRQKIAELEESSKRGDRTSLELGQTGQAAGVEGRLTKEAMNANQVTRTANAQMTAFENLSDFVLDIREDRQDLSDEQVQSLRAEAERLADTVVGTALNEIDARRAQRDLPALTQEEKIKAVGQINGIINELIQRGAGVFLPKETEQGAQMRGTKLVSTEARRGEGSVRSTYNPYDDAFADAKDAYKEAKREHTKANAAARAVIDAANIESVAPAGTPGKLADVITNHPAVKAEAEARKVMRAAGKRLNEAARKRAEYKKQQKTVERGPKAPSVFNNFEAASKAIRGYVRAEIDKIAGVAAPEYKPRPAPKVQKGERDLLNKTYSGAAGERSVATQFAEARKRASKADVATLDDIESKFKNLSPVSKSTAMELVRQVEIGRPLELPYQLSQELEDLGRAGVSDTGQQELFTGDTEKGAIRSTPSQFQRLLDSGKVAELRAKIAKTQREAAENAKGVAEAEKKLAEAVKQVEAMQAKLAAYEAKPASEKARKELSDLVDIGSPATQAIKAARNVQKLRYSATMRIRSAIAGLKEKATQARKQVANLEELQEFLMTMGVAHPYTTSDRLDVVIKSVDKQHAAAKKAVERLDKALADAESLLNKTIEKQTNDALGNELLNSGQEAQRKVDKAKQKLADALEAENAARRVLEARIAQPEQAPTPVKEEFAGPRTVVYRNTSDAAVQKQVRDERKNIGKLEEALLKAQSAKDEALVAEMSAALEKAYDKVYEILNNAPLRVVRAEDAATIKAFEEFEKAQLASADAMLAQLRELAGDPLFKLKPRDLGPVERTKTGGIKQTRKPLTVAQQEKIAAKAEESVLEKIGKKQARLREIERQLAYIQERPSTTPEARKKQAAAKSALKAEMATIKTELKALAVEQREVVKEQKEEARAEKIVRTEGRKMLRAKSRAEAAVEESEVDVTPAEATGVEAAVQDEGDLATPSIIDTERPTTALSDAAREMAEDGRIEDLLQELSVNGSTFEIRERASAMRGMVMRTKLTVLDEVMHEGKQVAGLYIPTKNEIQLDRAHLSEEDTLHEIVHAVTDRVLLADKATLTPTQLKAREGLENMWKRLSADPNFKEAHAAKSVREFVAEVRTNEVLRDKLHTVGKPESLWKRFVSFLKRLIGIDDRMTPAKADKFIEDIMQPSNKIVATATAAPATPSLFRSTPATPRDSDIASALLTADKAVARQRTVIDKLRVNGTGLGLLTQFVDRFAGLERLSKLMEPLRGTQMMYFLRMYDQRMNFVSQSVAEGALTYREVTRKDGTKEFLVESKPGASLRGVATILRGARGITGSGENTNKLFTMYLAAIRADRVGFDKLNFSEKDLTAADLKAAKAKIESNADLKRIFESARTEYNAYNEGLVTFVKDSGVLSAQEAKALLSSKDYIPFYREKNGVVELLIGGETPIKVGNIKEQPYLHDLVGGDTAILDFMTSSVQNTNMLVDMALRNKATKSAAYELQHLNLAKVVTAPTSGRDVVRFKEHGIDKYAIIETDSTGVPADILVKGMAGIPVQPTGILKLMQGPSTLLRKAVTLSPLYAARQLFRDSLAAPLLSGADMVPVYSALKEIGSVTKGTLERRGVTGGQVFTGGQQDLNDILKRVTDGKSTWMELVNKAETVAMEADAVTRRAQYNSYIKQGLSEMEATLMALESMNFNKRGASPSVHMLNALIPFFNAQIQGLNVLFRSLAGKMPFNERLRTQEKLMARGSMLVATSFAYAAAMQDDEAYQNASPEQRYGNWFIRVPGMDEPLKVPVPFEVGYIFKALPEAIYNTMVTERGGEEAVQAFKQILLQTIPGGTSYGIPQAMKPAIETATGKSFFTGRDILSKREQMLMPEAQFREDTLEVSKSLGTTFGISPILFENLIRGYTGTMGMAMLAMFTEPFMASDSPEKAVRRWSKVPVVGQAFQPNDAGFIISNTYDKMLELRELKQTVNDYINRGEIAKAKELINERGTDFARAGLADQFIKEMQNFSKAETAIRAAAISPPEKRDQLDKIRRLKIQYSAMMRDAFDKTTPQ